MSDNGGDMFTKTCFLIFASVKCVSPEHQSWQCLLTAAAIFQDCVTATRQYAYEREWRSHMEEHNKHWLCPYGCAEHYKSLGEFRSHLRLQHTVAETMLPSMSTSCARVQAIGTTVMCPLCTQIAPNYDKWFKHVGNHLRQLALFAIPSHLTSSNSEDELEANAEDEEEINQAFMTNEDSGVSHDEEQSNNEDSMAYTLDIATQNGRPYAPNLASSPRAAENHVSISDPASRGPSYRIYRRQLQGELPDSAAPLDFYPPKDSDELFDALRVRYPYLRSHAERMRKAETDFLAIGSMVESQSRRLLSPKQTPEHASDVEMYDADDQRDYILDLANPERTPSNSAESRGQQKHPATFQCTLCPKRFTRAYNLRSHLRTHTDERPFVCIVCGKAFARDHDRKRHQGLHSSEKEFVCRGTLQSSAKWGCSRRFARAEALGRHFRSEAGRACIRPLLDEEQAKRQKVSLEENLIPEALFQQYPALAGLDWNALPLDPPRRSSFDASSSRIRANISENEPETHQQQPQHQQYQPPRDYGGPTKEGYMR
jgi:hypothetical protein